MRQRDSQPRTPIFNYAKWHFELIQALGSYRLLKSYASDDAALKTYMAGRGRPWGVDQSGNVYDVPDDQIERFREPIADTIDEAIETYRRQLIVIIISVTEAATAEAFEVLFFHKPLVLKELSKDTAIEKFSTLISLDDLMAATHLADLTYSVVDKAVTYACQGKNKRTVLRRLSRLFSSPIDTDVQKNYLDLLDLRNRIVHDNSRDVVSGNEIEAFFDLGISFVRVLAGLIEARGLPIDDSHLRHESHS